MFGSSGYSSQPKSARCSFIKRSSTWYSHKSAARISSIDRFDVHHHYLKPGFKYVSAQGRLNLNHYRIQSREYFEKTKMGRGDVSRSIWDSIRM